MTTPSASTESFHLNPASEAFVRAPDQTYAQLREQAPLYYWAERRAWVLTRYEDVVTALTDPRFSTDNRQWRHASSLPAQNIPALARIMDNGLLTMPAADHRRVRKLVAPAFSPRSIARLEGQVQGLVDDLLTAAGADTSDTLDICTALAEPLPIRAISTMLDIPADRDEAFREWGGNFIRLALAYLPREVQAEAARRTAEGIGMVDAIIDERRQNLGDDVLSKLIAAQEDGDRLSQDELVSLVAGLIIAGSETTVHLINWTVYLLLSRPDDWRRLQRDPALLPSAIEEALRFENFGKMGVTRFAVEDIEMHGQTIEKGDMIITVLASASRDQEVWPDAQRFDITRDPMSNISFGRGAHFCLGAHLARLEGRVAVQTLLERFPTMRLVGEPEFNVQHPFIRQMTSLKVSLRP